PRRGISMMMPVSVARAIRETRADVVHVHTGTWFKGARAAALAGVRCVVYTEHGREHDDPPLMRWLDRQASRSTTRVVAVSARLARYLADVVGIPAAKLSTIANGVDTDVFSPGPPPEGLRASLGLDPDAIILGSVGRLETVKAYEHLLDAAASLRARLDRPLAVVLAGDGSQR